MVMLERELDKIHDFQKEKTGELARRIVSAEKSVHELVQEEEAYHASLTASHYGGAESGNDLRTNGNGIGHAHRHYHSRDGAHYSHGDAEEQRHHITHTQDGGSDDDLDTDDEDEPGDDTSGRSVETLEERFRWLEEEVAVLVADVHDLALYTKLNLTGFMKILKVRSSCYRVDTLVYTLPET